MSLKRLLLEHIRTYPAMQAEDMLKLIYQNEFGAGHFAPDQEECLEKLKSEMLIAENTSGNGRLFDDIGNNLCRLHIGAAKNAGIEARTLNMFFINTARRRRGNNERFEKKLGIFLRCCESGDLPFLVDECRKLTALYKERGYPPISHSDLFKAGYMPAYRVVERDYCIFFDAFVRIDCLMRSKDPVIAAIDGRCGSGKSTLAGLVGSVYGCNTFHTDDFFPDRRAATKQRREEELGNLDHERLRREVLDGIREGGEFYFRRYDCRTGSYSPKVKARPKRLNIVEGSYSMHPALEEYYDLKIFLYIRKSEQERRIMRRNGQFMLDRFVNEWIPMEEKYFRETNIIERSDLVYKI